MASQLMTVTGPVSPDTLGLTLPHEHIMTRFGLDPARYPDYPVERLLAQVMPYLARVKSLGVNAIADCTTAFFGRHPELLRRISTESEILILTNTGYYGARRNRYVPEHAFAESPEQIAARWTREWQDGIDETGVRPGFIKIAVEEEPLSEMEEKLVQAAILTHQQTRLVIQTHTGDNPQAARQILEMLAHAGVPGSVWIWVHAHVVEEFAHLLDATSRGAWISLDGISPASEAHILHQLQELRVAGALGQTLLSHDGDSFTADGGLRPYDYLLTGFLPFLKNNGFSKDEIHLLTVVNPAKVFTIHQGA